jgi:guanidinopropionase
MNENQDHKFKQYDVNQIPRFANINPLMRATFQEDPSDLDVAMFGVPFDLGSSFRTGSRHGPAQIREMSRLIKQVHYPSMQEPFNDFKIADVGDAPVNSLDIEESLDRIHAFVDNICSKGAVPLAAGGDHTISLPILRAIAKDAPVSMIQIDAHADVLDEMLGKKYANGTPFRRAIEEGLLDPKRIVQIGLRGSLFHKDDHKWAKEQGITQINIDQFYKLGIEGVVNIIKETVKDTATYLTFDMDVIDPAFAPGVGGLEPGGLTSREAQLLLRNLTEFNIIGADINEVSPPYDASGNTALLAANLMFEILCLLTGTIKRREL